MGGNTRRYHRGDYIFEEGKRENSMVFIVEGKAMLHSMSKRIQMPIVSESWWLCARALFPGQDSGTMKVFMRSESLVALSPCTTLEIDQACFLHAVDEFSLHTW